MLVCLIGLWVKGGDPGSLARTWSLALVAGLVYRAPHPVQHGYLASALALIGSISLAVPVAWLMGLSGLARPMRLLAILLILGQAVPRAPFFCSPLESIRALGPLGQVRIAPADPPPGCRVRSFQPKFSHYSWTDYCRALEYLRRTTTPDTEIANVLKQTPYPCFNGPLGRLSPFRSESGICWMLLVDMDLDEEFARELEQSPHSVVVWSPSEIGLDSPLKLPRLTDLISELYRREAQIWSHRGMEASVQSESRPDTQKRQVDRPRARGLLATCRSGRRLRGHGGEGGKGHSASLTVARSPRMIRSWRIRSGG